MSGNLMSDIDEYGFKRTDIENKAKSEYLTVLSRRYQRWSKAFPNHIERGRKLQRFIRKGIPLSMRKKVWMITSGGQREMEAQPDFYSNILKSQYQAEIVEVIKIDIPRTFPENIYFEVHKNELFNVLVAFAHQNTAVGYCQGLNYISGLMLIITKDELASFWLLKHFVEVVAPGYHSHKMAGLQRDIHVISEIVRLREPLVNEKINEIGLPWAVILTKWLICLFSEVLPVETVLRVWDVMFVEGYKIIFRAALAIILILKDDIMQTTDITELAELFRNLNKDPRFLDCHTFLEFMFKIKLKRRDIDTLRTNYRA